MFIAIHPEALGSADEMERIVEGVVLDIKGSGEKVLYPGERSMAARRESMTLGVLVERDVWEGILALHDENYSLFSQHAAHMG